MTEINENIDDVFDDELEVTDRSGDLTLETDVDGDMCVIEISLFNEETKKHEEIGEVLFDFDEEGELKFVRVELEKDFKKLNSKISKVMKKEFDGNVYDDGKELTLSLKIAAKELSKFLKS
jgi:uncharacterized protein YuzE